tara:strand:- start:428 stop:1060 length:633 start_codon:yes stop_codon:yes gene_type:complete
MARVGSPIFEGDGTGHLELDGNTCFHLVECFFSDGSQPNIYLTDRFHDTTITTPTAGAQTYSAAGGMLSFSSVVETTQIKVNTITVSLSGVDNRSTGIIADVLNYPIVNQRVAIYRSFDTATAPANMNNTYLIFDGNVKNFSIQEEPTGSTISLQVATHWANFEQKNGRITNSTAQANTTKYNSTDTFASDRGFEYASAMIADITWGPSN